MNNEAGGDIAGALQSTFMRRQHREQVYHPGTENNALYLQVHPVRPKAPFGHIWSGLGTHCWAGLNQVKSSPPEPRAYGVGALNMLGK